METYSVLTDWKSIVKMSILPKAIYMFNVNPIKIPMDYPIQRKNNIKFHMEPQKTLNSQGGITLPDLKPYYVAIVIKVVW